MRMRAAIAVLVVSVTIIVSVIWSAMITARVPARPSIEA
jgi:hypothetical protein